MTPEKLSASRINTYLTCPMRYYFRYIVGEKIQPTGAMMLGTQFHGGVGFNMEQKIGSHEDLPTKEVIEYYSACYDQAAYGIDWKEGEDRGKLKDTGVSILTEYQEIAAPTIQPVHVEQHLLVQTPDYEFPFEGYVDCVDDESRIIETKTTARRVKEPMFAHQVQGSFYALMFRSLGVDETALRFDYAVKTKTPQILTFKHAVNLSDMKMITSLVKRVTKGIEQEVWIPSARGSWTCTRKWCAYYKLCEAECGGRIPD